MEIFLRYVLEVTENVKFFVEIPCVEGCKCCKVIIKWECYVPARGSYLVRLPGTRRHASWYPFSNQPRSQALSLLYKSSIDGTLIPTADMIKMK